MVSDRSDEPTLRVSADSGEPTLRVSDRSDEPTEIETLYMQLSLKQRQHIKEYMKLVIIRENETKKFSDELLNIYENK
jgi:hypothetical protein